MKRRRSFSELKKVFRRLYGPQGCPWDRKQTFKSLIPYFREEADELVMAVKNGDLEHIKEEIGDVLMHVMAYSQIAAKEGMFDIDDVIDALIAKLKRRHPHVFGDVKVRSGRQIIANWNRIKNEEKAKKQGMPAAAGRR